MNQTEPETEEDVRSELAEAATLAAALKGTGEAMMQGLLTQQDALELLAHDLGKREGVVKREGALASQGRAHFGRKREGQEGVALFIPTEEGADAE